MSYNKKTTFTTYGSRLRKNVDQIYLNHIEIAETNKALKKTSTKDKILKFFKIK